MLDELPATERASTGARALDDLPTLALLRQMNAEDARVAAADVPEIRMVDAAGIPAAAKEAICFAVLGHEALHGRPNTLPGATGARRATVLGAIWPGDGFRQLMERATHNGGAGPLRRIAVSGEAGRQQKVALSPG